MTGRGASPSDEQQDRGRGTGRLLLVAAMALALVAAALLVLSDNARWLRLAVVSALWAALVGAFLAARYRRQVADREDEVADLQSVYELELEREVAARREYELEIEAESRKRVQEESRDDLDALRDELRALRENLQALLGGEVLVERVALRAESTRMRSLSDQSRLMAIGDRQIINSEGNERVRGITAGPSKPTVKKVVPESTPAVERTELIERVVSEQRKPARQEPTRPPSNYTEPVRREPSRAQQRPQPPIVVRRDPPEAGTRPRAAAGPPRPADGAGEPVRPVRLDGDAPRSAGPGAAQTRAAADARRADRRAAEAEAARPRHAPAAGAHRDVRQGSLRAAPCRARAGAEDRVVAGARTSGRSGRAPACTRPVRASR